MFEELVTYGAVVGAAACASWRLMPGVLRVALAKHCTTLAKRLGLAQADAEAETVRRWATGTSTCGGCSGCSHKQAPQGIAIVITRDAKDT
jgi:hypothetical protein